MGWNPFNAGATLPLQVPAPIAGFALQNGTPTIAEWTAPNDGNVHYVSVFGATAVTSAETGGAIKMTATAPNGTTGNPSLDAGSNAVGLVAWSTHNLPVQPGSTTTVQQTSALTVGAALAFCAIFGV